MFNFARNEGEARKGPRIVGIKNKNTEDETQPQRDAIEEKRAEDGSAEVDNEDNKYREKKGTEKLSNGLAVVVLLFCFGIFGLVLLMDNRLPKPLTLADSANNPERFIEERARDHLRQLTSVGPRPAGSYENEVLAVEFIRRQLTKIQKATKSAHNLVIDVQKPRGSFNLPFVDGLTQNYRDITNIVVKLEPSIHRSKDALLVNCHFDSVPQSPGASDDAVSCAIMLEVLEVITQSDTALKNTILFLFNGAEENLLPASHGFITQHKWAQEARAFINLEACGAGGRELVFQSGPGHSWLIEAYAKAAPHPFASVIGQEIFQSGVIPGDTDFRIFRDHGKIPGLDIAYVKNGYIYHTKYDTEDRIPSGSIQRAGDNVLAVVKHLGDSEILAHTEDSNKGSIVFFDLLGLCLIYYPEWIGIIVNICVIVASVGITVNKTINSFQYGVTSKTYLKQLGYTLLTQIMGCVASFAVVTFIALILDATGRTMSWYAKPWLIFFLYMCPTVMAVCAVFYFALPRQKQYFQFADGVWVIESLYFEVSISLDSLHFSHDHFGIKILIFLHDMGIFPHDGSFGARKNVRSFGNTKKKQRLEMVNDSSIFLGCSPHYDDVPYLYDILDVHPNNGSFRIFLESRLDHWLQGSLHDFGHSELHMSFIYGAEKTTTSHDNFIHDHFFISHIGCDYQTRISLFSISLQLGSTSISDSSYHQRIL